MIPFLFKVERYHVPSVNISDFKKLIFSWIPEHLYNFYLLETIVLLDAVTEYVYTTVLSINLFLKNI